MSPVRTVPARSARERGQASLEVVAVAGLVAVVMALALHLFSAIYAGQAAGRVAWDAARARSLGQSPSAAADASTPGGLSLVSVETLGDGVRVTVRSPKVIPWLDAPTASRTAYVP